MPMYFFSDKAKCMNCNGNGTLTCDECNGEGEVPGYSVIPFIDPEYDPCPSCNGDGKVTCDECDGTGEVDEEED